MHMDEPPHPSVQIDLCFPCLQSSLPPPPHPCVHRDFRLPCMHIEEPPHPSMHRAFCLPCVHIADPPHPRVHRVFRLPCLHIADPPQPWVQIGTCFPCLHSTATMTRLEDGVTAATAPLPFSLDGTIASVAPILTSSISCGVSICFPAGTTTTFFRGRGIARLGFGFTVHTVDRALGTVFLSPPSTVTAPNSCSPTTTLSSAPTLSPSLAPSFCSFTSPHTSTRSISAPLP
mmetsp:Transcript_27294/g.68331  ORF Transcript_27294/g.68331 Transcript_27294/m.68331 type:complete len:231 (-) Transcript_27294:11-703(-)